MTFKTHKAAGVSAGLVATMLLCGRGVWRLNYYLALPIMLEFSKVGALFPDLDHEWKNVKEKTPLNYAINKLIHITGGKHRSWQTHSIDILFMFCIFVLWLPRVLMSGGLLLDLTREIITVIGTGFLAGWASHLLMDMLTIAGVRPMCILDWKVSFIPRKVLGQRMWYFKTGGDWEQRVYIILFCLNIVIWLLALIWPLLMNYSEEIVAALTPICGDFISNIFK